MSPAASKEDTGQEAGEKVQKKSGKGKKIIFILLVVLVLAGAGGAGWYFFLADRGEVLPEAPPEPQVEIYSPSLSFTVNLAGAGQRRFLRSTLVFGYQEPGLTEELALKEPKVRDRIITIMRAKSLEDVSTGEGEQQLSVEIKEVLNEFLEGSPILEVFFTEFVIQ